LKIPFKFLYFGGLVFCSYLIGNVLYASYHSDNIFAIFIYVGLGLVWLINFYRIIKKEHLNSTAHFKLVKYWLSIFSVLTLVPIVLIYLHYQRKLNVPSLIKAERHGVYADFKNDGTYVIKSGAWASKTHFYGKYILHDSIIQIDTSNLDNVLTSNRFLIKHANLAEEKNRPDYDRLNTENYLVQIDKDGTEIKARKIRNENLPYKFEVIVDNRR
jgi:hypothetical protein